MSRHKGAPIKLCMPCGEALLRIPPGCSNAQVVAACLQKLCRDCAFKVSTMHAINVGRAKVERARAAAPDLSALQPDSSGWADVKKRR